MIGLIAALFFALIIVRYFTMEAVIMETHLYFMKALMFEKKYKQILFRLYNDGHISSQCDAYIIGILYRLRWVNKKGITTRRFKRLYKKCTE